MGSGKRSVVRNIIVFLLIVFGIDAIAEDSKPAFTASVDERGWLQLTGDSGAATVSGKNWPVNVFVDDAMLLKDADAVKVWNETLDTVGIAVHHETERGELTSIYTPFPSLGDCAWLRTLTYTNKTEATQDLLNAWMYVQFKVPENTLMWSPRNFYMARGAENLLYALAYKGTTEHYRLLWQDGAVGHEVHACWRLSPGEKATIDAQAIWVRSVANGIGMDEREWGRAFRDEAQRWYSAIDLRVPAGMPDWAREMILYEYNAGGHMDSRFSDVGGFTQLAKQTEYLAAMGVNAVWLQAVHEHKTPPNPMKGGWNLYDPLDVLRVDSIMGGEAGLHELSDGLQNAGIHILGESVPHGGHSKQAEALPEWWTYERDGSPRRNWGGCGMDRSSPEWQRIMAESMAWQAQTFGFEGCRVDVADGSGPNWKSPRTNHASYSTLGGAVELLNALRTAMIPHTPYPLLIPEAFDQVEYFRITPVGYGHDFWMFTINELQPLVNDPAAMVNAFRNHLERERGSLPAGALTLRTLNNHDTVCEAGRVHHRFGAGLARALHGICLMIPGIPMLYQEQEIGDWFALRDMHWARRSIPEFTSEEVEYFAVTVAPEVFACLRGNAQMGFAIGLSNLSGQSVEGKVSIADWVQIAEDTTVHDGVSGVSAKISENSVAWTLKPYATALLRVGNPPLEMKRPIYGNPEIEFSTEEANVLGPELVFEDGELFFTNGDMRVAFLAGQEKWRLGADDAEGRTYMTDTTELRVSEFQGGLHCELSCVPGELNDWPAIVLTKVDTWQVSGRTAMLHDHALHRHYPWPESAAYVWDKSMSWVGYEMYNRISPTGRLWESVIDPLHPDVPAVCFRDSAGKRIRIADIETDVKNLLLCEGDDYALRMEFRGRDAELAPSVAVAGIGQPYCVESQVAADDDFYTTSFILSVISGATTEEERRTIETPRMDADRRAYQMALSGDEASINHRLGVVLPNPGKVSWKGIALPKGRYRLKFTMRHSEVSPEGTDLDDAYEISVNNQPLTYEWTARNVFQYGNAYYGEVLTDACDCGGDSNEITISTNKKWCMIKEQFVLSDGR